jgi:CRISPR-associated protein Csb2
MRAIDDGEAHARRLCVIAELLYQLGRGVDMAWARGEIINAHEIETQLATHAGAIYRPATGVAASCCLLHKKGLACES